MSDHATSSQGQRTPTPEELPWTRCDCYDGCPFFVGLTYPALFDVAYNIQTGQQEQRERFSESERRSPYDGWMLDYKLIRSRRNYFTYLWDDLDETLPAYSTTMVTLPLESQNDSPNREAATDWPQSQQCTLVCSLHGTVRILWLCDQAWESTKHMQRRAAVTMPTSVQLLALQILPWWCDNSICLPSSYFHLSTLTRWQCEGITR